MARLVIVSNRVGSTLKANEGGLATAIQSAVGERDVVWFGWSGEVCEGTPGETKYLREGRLIRALVDIEASDYEGYYVGFSNRVLWPLFHYRPNLADYNREDWAAYLRVNDFLAERLAAMLLPDDVVWIHDYHLIPFAQALRRRGVRNSLGFFLHIPFPASEVMVVLPVHAQLMEALFAYDLVGFQTDKDTRAFYDYVGREAGGRISPDRETGLGVAYAFGSSVRADTFPISIDTARVATVADRASRTPHAKRLRDSLSGRHLAIGIDRLDYTKGLLRRFAAVERLYEDYPIYRRGLVVLQIAPPSREDVPEYQQIRADLDARIGRINGRFGEPDILPVRYLNRHFRQESLFGFYRSSRIGLVTPLRDGMNLVAKEYVASQDPEDPGVLVLSRFAGAAAELEAALLVNPVDVDQVAEALHRAASMPLDERKARYKSMMDRLTTHDVHRWFRTFLGKLQPADPQISSAQENAA